MFITRRRHVQRGDTLIEVLLAIAVFSAAAVSAVMIMNHGITNAQRSLEITLVRNQINNQAELLRHLNNVALVSSGRLFAADAASGSLPVSEVQDEWSKLPELVSNSAGEYDEYDTIQSVDDCSPTEVSTEKAFFVDPKTGKIHKINTTAPVNFQKDSPFAKVNASDPALGQEATSDMIWIYAVRSTGPGEGRDELDNTDFYDFHIRACWDSPDGRNVQKLGTIVRLYEPK